MSDLSLGARPLLAGLPARALILALLVFVAGLIYLDQAVSSRQAALWAIGTLLGAWSAIPEDNQQASAAFMARVALTRSDLEGSLPYLTGAARSAASVIRDRFSPDAWRAINDLAALIGAPHDAGDVGEDLPAKPLLGEADPELERLLAEEEEIERRTREHHETPHFRGGEE